MTTLAEMIILSWWLLFMASRFTNLMIILPNIMAAQKGKGYQEIRAIEAFEYTNIQ